MPDRRSFLCALASAATFPASGWAEGGAPAWLACALEPSGAYALFGLRADGGLAFRVGLPARGHAGARHPSRPLAVVMARRPGGYALAIDCASGATHARLAPPDGLQFNGHAAFVQGGDLLATSEQRADDSAGRIGLWRTRDWRRVGDWSTGGLGPHEIVALPGGGLAAANGGIATDPSDRRKLNLDSMRPSLALLDGEGRLSELVELAPALRRNSIRHLALRADGMLAFAMQWEGAAAETPPLLGLRRPDGAVSLAEAPGAQAALMRGYAGSVAWSGDGMRVAITSPHGGRMQVFDAAGRFTEALSRRDICGLAPFGAGFLASDGAGALIAVDAQGPRLLGRGPAAWDNHIVSV